MRLGRKKESDAEWALFTRRHSNDDAFSIAQNHAFRGEADAAFQWLNRAYAQRNIGLYLIKGDPLLKNLESDPRYKPFLRKMNLPD